jgi:hypothetical protein
MPQLAAVTNYVCADCGYLESYLLDHDDRAQIRAGWQRVPPTDDARA